MIVTLHIGANSRDSRATDLVQWLNQQITDRRNNGDPVCVTAHVKDTDVDLNLAAGQCGSGGSGRGRPPNSREDEIIKRWRNHVSEKEHFTGGNIKSFLQSL